MKKLLFIMLMFGFAFPVNASTAQSFVPESIEELLDDLRRIEAAGATEEFKYAASFVLSGGVNGLLENINGFTNVKWKNCKVTYTAPESYSYRLMGYNPAYIWSTIMISRVPKNQPFATFLIDFNKANWKSAYYTFNNPNPIIKDYFSLDGEMGLLVFTEMLEENKKYMRDYDFNELMLEIGPKNSVVIDIDVPYERIDEALTDVISICPGSSQRY